MLQPLRKFYRQKCNYFRFLPADQTSDSPLRVLSPRVGDVDLDGFPDLLVTLYNHDKLGEGASLSSVAEPMLLLNTGCGSFSGCHPTWRQFQLSPGFMQGTGNGVMAAFFDLYEDGKLDVVVVDAESKSVTAWSNTTQNSDAYFIKVRPSQFKDIFIVLITGDCAVWCLLPRLPLP